MVNKCVYLYQYKTECFKNVGKMSLYVGKR